MATSRGVRLCLLAARGLLKCPDDYKYLYFMFKEKGIDIEIMKEMLYSNMQGYLASKDFDTYNSTKKELTKLLFPDVESPEDKLMKTAKNVFKDKSTTLKVGKTTQKAIDLNRFNIQKVYVDG